MFDSVIFGIAAHGASNGMICSDGDALDTKYIRSLFGAEVKKEFAHIPKILVFNFCRNESKACKDSNDNRGTVSYSVTITGPEGKAAFGSDLSKYVTPAFSESRTGNKPVRKDVVRK
eukprot:715573_1